MAAAYNPVDLATGLPASSLTKCNDPHDTQQHVGVSHNTPYVIFGRDLHQPLQSPFCVSRAPKYRQPCFDIETRTLPRRVRIHLFAVLREALLAYYS